ncbi:MAG: biotin/lipoyl-binding protein, partial [Planctomycetes bacterium]|nr:biotin/lipoyl-binding protein [Planctomycetota bacterium]
MLARALVILAVSAALLTALLLRKGDGGPLVVSGIIEAEEIRVGSRVGGRVRKVLVEEGQTITTGTVLVELEPFDLLEERANAEAELAARRAELERLESGYREEEIAQA